MALFKKLLSEALNEASLFLEQNNHDPSLARHYWMSLFDWSLTELVLALNQEITEDKWQKFKELLKRVIKDEPLQYILGRAYFMDEVFKVSPASLIPREETAGLVQLAYEYLEVKPKSRVLDIGSGSGIIAIMLAKSFPQAQLTAIDISQEALEIAQENAQTQQVKINFLQSDLFNQIHEEKFDLIISNPPYIAYNELDLMDESVKKYEPQQALFAGEKGLDIYQRISQEVPPYIEGGGQILFEIGFAQGPEVKELFLTAFPNAEIEVLKDFNDLDRYVRIQLKKEGELC